MAPEIKRHNTAIKRKVHSAPVKWALKQGLIRGPVYDFGCGRGDDVRILNENGIKATGYDPYHSPENHPAHTDFSKYGTFMCNYVLNVIEEPQERTSLLRMFRNIWQQMPRFSKMIVSVRPKEEIDKDGKKKGWTPYKGGWLTPSKTFQKGFTPNGMKAQFTKAGLEVQHIEKLSGGYVFLIQKG